MTSFIKGNLARDGPRSRLTRFFLSGWLRAAEACSAHYEDTKRPRDLPDNYVDSIV